MDDLFSSAEYDSKKRTITVDGDTYKLQRDVPSGRWKGWAVEPSKYAELAAAEGASESFDQRSPEWPHLYFSLWLAALDRSVTAPNELVAAVRAGMERDRERRLIAEGLAAGFNADESAVQAAD